MSVSYTWIYSIPTVLRLAFYIGALVFLIGKRGRHPQAARLAITGVGILLLTHVGGWLSMMVVGRLVTSGNFVLYSGVIQILWTFANLTGMGILLAAVFAYRRGPTEADPWGATELPVASDNPYEPPTTR